MLTLDARMQRIATQSLQWGMRAVGLEQGVTAVMNPQTGEILAMVSLPTYDNNQFATGISAAEYAVYLNDPAKPLRNHAIADIYPPGSTFKLVTGLAALEEGVTSAGRQWPTYGCYQIPNAQWAMPVRLESCGLRAAEHDPGVRRQLRHLLLPDGGGFGRRPAGEVGQPPRIRREIGNPAAGRGGGDRRRRGGRARRRGEDVFTGELAQAGIARTVAVTPLQLLNAYAALANGGRLMEPMIVRGETDDRGKLTKAYKPRVIRRIDASQANLQTMRIGAREVITTGHAYNIRDLRLRGR